MDAHFAPLLPLTHSPIQSINASLAFLLLFGLLFGFLASKIKLPTITGNIIAGFLLGPLFGVVNTGSPENSVHLEPLVNLALALISVSIGSHIKFAHLHNSLKRISVIVLLQLVFLPLIVFCGVYFVMSIGGYEHYPIQRVALFLGILSLATAPATVVHIVKETQSKGVFVKTLVAVVALNNVVNIVVFELVRTYVFSAKGTPSMLLAVQELGELFGAFALGGAVALTLIYLRRKVFCKKCAVTFSVAVFIIAYGLAVQLDFSPVLTNLSLGVFLANFSDRNHILEIFEDFEELIYAMFFTLTGTHAVFQQMKMVGTLALAYLGLRFLGNYLVVYLSTLVTEVPGRVKRYLAVALTPQGGITIGLIAALMDHRMSQSVASLLTPVMLTAIIVAEIIGPILLRYCLKQAGEVGHAVPRLIDFIHEEYILVNVGAQTKDEVIVELGDFLYKTHPIPASTKEAFLKSVFDHEKRICTGVGKGIAIPRGILPEGDQLMGVMAIFKDGISWDSMDGKDVHMIMLLGRSESGEGHFKQVLNTVSKLFARRGVKERGLHLSRSAAHVYEVFTDEEFESLNKVLAE